MKIFTFIFAIVGLVVSFFIGSLLFTRAELVELAQNHHALYEQQQSNMDFDTWLEQTHNKLADTQMSLYYLDSLSALIFPSQKSELKQVVKDSQSLLTEYEQLLNALVVESNQSPSFKKIWEVTFLNYSPEASNEVMQTLFKSLPNLISELQDNMVVIETQQQIIQSSQQLAIRINRIIKENKTMGKTFMLDSFAALPNTIWLSEAIPTIEEAEPTKAEEATNYYERKLAPPFDAAKKQSAPDLDAVPSADELLKALSGSVTDKQVDKNPKPENKATPTAEDIEALEADVNLKPSKQKSSFVET